MKVLQIMNKADAGGISAVLLRDYQVIDREAVQFDCAMPDTRLGPHGLQFQALGSQIIQLPLKSKHPLQYGKALRRILKEGGYDAVHVNSNETSFFPLLIAKSAGIPVRIAHAHTARPPKTLRLKLKRLLSVSLTPRVATKLVAPTTAAAECIFGKKARKSPKLVYIKNAVDLSEYRFSEQWREETRQTLGLEGKFAVCCVSNLDPVKNHSFSLRVFREVLSRNADARLVLIGDGERREAIRQEAAALGVLEQVQFLGRRSDVNRLLSGMDAFLMPSLYEGFALAALEAAACGLPIFLSDTIPGELKFYTDCTYLSLQAEPKLWAEQICRVSVEDRAQGAKEVLEAGYDLRQNAAQFASLYRE